jgi:hypothetical protein
MYDTEGLSVSTELVYIVKDLTLIVSVDLIETKSEAGSSLLPILDGSSSHPLVKKIIPANRARKKVLLNFSENDLRRGINL